MANTRSSLKASPPGTPPNNSIPASLNNPKYS